MKKLALLLTVFAAGAVSAQQVIQEKIQPQISVTGEGKIKVTPDEAVITIGVENTGADAAEVKKKNDASIENVVKYLKNMKLPTQDYQTKRVYLNKTYDYNKKKYNYTASQTIVINLKDLSKYDSMMMGLIDAGVNTIQGVEFKSSKIAQHESEARKKAVQDARLKASDYAGALNQTVGKAIVVSDNSQTYYPVVQRQYMKLEAASASADMPRETIAIGEIEITSNVSITFILN